MSEPTLIASLCKLRHWSYESFAANFRTAAARSAAKQRNPEIAKADVSRSTWERWCAGKLRTQPQVDTRMILEEMFGYPVADLLSPVPEPEPDAGAHAEPVTGPSGGRTVERMLAMSARRARQFTAAAEASNIGDEGLADLRGETERIARAYPVTPVTDLVEDIASLQDETLTLLEGHQPVPVRQDLSVIGALASGMMGKAAHDLHDPRTAMTHARLAWTCASDAGHGTLQAWVRGLESLIVFWAGRAGEAHQYASSGLEIPGVTGTVRVWLYSLDARAQAQLGAADDALRQVQAAKTAREEVVADELDEIGGLCRFDIPRQEYYAADSGTLLPPQFADSRLGRGSADHARAAIDGYAAAPAPAFGDQAGSHVALAIAQIRAGEHDGAADTMAPVLGLPLAMRINGVVACVRNVHRELAAAAPQSASARQLQQQIEAFARPAVLAAR